MLNVLNRLELEDNQQHPETELITQSPLNTTQTAANEDEIKWEYKSNDTFKEYNYYEVVTSESKTPEPQSVDDQDEEPGALFFQIPDQRQDFEKHETLNLQETKNAIASSSDLLIGDLTEETEKPKPSEAPTTSTTSTIQPKKEIKISEKDVEVFQAPLLTAFTLEHDERGLPRRIIPLEQSELRSILDNRISPDVQPDVRRVRDPGPVFHVPQAPIPLFQEEKRIRFELETQFQQLQERKRQIELEKERLLAEQEKSRRFKYALEQRQKEQEYLRALSQNEIGRPEIAFQKSVEPAVPINTFGRSSIVLQPLFPLPSKPAQPQYITDSVDRHLQHLFHRSGLGRQEDLNIVSKILALNHEGEEEKPKQKQPVNQEQVNSELAARNQQRLLPTDQRFTLFT